MRNTVAYGTEQSKIDTLATFGEPENMTTQMSRSPSTQAQSVMEQFTALRPKTS